MSDRLKEIKLWREGISKAPTIKVSEIWKKFDWLISALSLSRDEVTRLRENQNYWIREYQKQYKNATNAAHVIVEAGIGHEDLNACGCQCCEDVRKSMVEAGYLKPENTEEMSDE